MRSQQVRELIETALGIRKADTVLIDTVLANVYTGKLEYGMGIGIIGDRFAYVGRDVDRIIGAETGIYDVRGRYAIPGLIDAHTHLDSMFTCREYARYAILGGNTTAVSETAMIANALGPKGVEWFMESCEGLPMRVFFLTPSLAPPFPELESSAGFDENSFDGMIRRENVLGVGESYWPGALDMDPRFLHQTAEAHTLGKTREGHAAGARDERLAAYVAAGVSSCHEATNPAEALERLRLGVALQIREGYIRRELEAIAPLFKDLQEFRNVMLTTDLASLDEVIRKGAMMELVRKAVSLGCEPVRAVQMASLNPACYFGLRDLGAIAPNKLADLVLVDNLKDFNCLEVWVGGRRVVEEDICCVDVPRYRFPSEAYRSIRTGKVLPGHLRIPVSADRVRARAVSVVNETISREHWVELTARDGVLASDPEKDLVKMAVIDRKSPDVSCSLGLVHNTGIRRGALALSLLWDTCNILVVGVSDAEMAAAANALIEHGGGYFVVQDDKVMASYPLPVGGLISEAPLPEIVSSIDQVEKAVRALGCKVERPVMTFQTLCFTGLPFLRLTDKGLVDVRKRSFVSFTEDV